MHDPYQFYREGELIHGIASDHTGFVYWKPDNAHYPEKEAQIRLILAAPDMFEVVLAARSFIDDDAIPYPEPGGYTLSQMKHALDDIIAKVRGEVRDAKHRDQRLKKGGL